MKGETGFIVTVRPKNEIVDYTKDGSPMQLKPGETFTGYFWQELHRAETGGFLYAHIKEVILLNESRKLFHYGGKAVFLNSDVEISIHALRGPRSNNSHLPEKYKKYETWNEIPR